MAAVCTIWVEKSQAEEAIKFDAAAFEFFEKDVRPLLVKHCYECHGPEAKRLEGNLLLTSRENVLAGGDTGPAVVPGDLKESLLVDAIRYGEFFEMPPKGKMPKDEIAILERWVEMGAPWPEGDSGPDPRQKFDLEERRKSHWAWQPILDAAPPVVKDKAWPSDPLDNFILARLEKEGLTPNGPADARTLVRRVYFDLIGLPPSPAEVREFLQDCGVDPAKPDDPAIRIPPAALEKLVDKLLASPHFGERWGRHWLDLMRYAESRGHEFDYEAPNAFEYRDYVIRALNADVPYDQFTIEHIAGDLLDKPRTNPDQGYNESIIATGFWHLGEWVHSPVDTRQDECDRLDNQIDTFSKTFLGMTVACARCHDHKFDAISQSDYYALAGFVQSSDYRLARFESLDHNRRIAEQLHALRTKSGQEIARLNLAAQRPVLDKLDTYLLAAREMVVGPTVATRSPDAKSDVIFADFESGNYDGWSLEGTAFADKPVTSTQPQQQVVSGWQGKFYVNTYTGSDSPQGKAISRPFKLEHRYITLLVGGGGHTGQTCVNLVMDGKVTRTVTGVNNEKLDPAHWDVSEFKGKEARLEIIDAHSGGWGHINVDHIVFTDTKPSSGEASRPALAVSREQVVAVAANHGLDADVLAAWLEQLTIAKTDVNDPLHLWARLTFEPSADNAQVAAIVQQVAANLAARAAQLPQLMNGAQVIIDYTQGDRQPFMPDGSAFGVAPLRTGDVLLSHDAAAPLAGFAPYGAVRRDLKFTGFSLAGGSQNEAGEYGGWQRPEQTVRTPTFTIENGPVHYLVRGAGRALAVVDSHRMVVGPLHGEVRMEWGDDQGRVRWVTHNLQRHKGHRAHVEFSPHGNSEFEILMVAQGPQVPGVPLDIGGTAALAKAFEGEKVRTLGDVVVAYRSLLDDAATIAGRGFPEVADRQPNAAIANWIAQRPRLFITAAAKASDAGQQLAAAGGQFVEAENQLAGQIKRTSRAAPAMLDGTAENEVLLIRGKPSTPGPAVPRRMLTALGGKDADALVPGSGRLMLAQRVVDPTNPLTSRVMANRVWHHLFGRGIVPTTDNFGVLGEAPTHPELLDHLATRFMREGWSVKRLIKAIVLSRAYQMSSQPNKEAEETDPGNKWLHRMNIRRLEGEIVRDSLLAVSGRLNRDMYGPPVPVHLTEFMTGRGKPAGGPLDGNGRRSIYIAIRRNFLSPMMLAFDMPLPSATVGRRTVSNVPAQPLIMMNDRLVQQQAQLWATRSLADGSLSPEARIAQLYEAAYARQPTADETAEGVKFLSMQGARLGIPEDQRAKSLEVWADFCHVLFNVKEFIFIN